jgi:hypothetical protein
LAVCLNISTVINIKILTNSNQQIQSYKFTSHIAVFLSVVLITEMLEICIQTSYDQNVQLIVVTAFKLWIYYGGKYILISLNLAWKIGDPFVSLRGYHTLQGDNSLKSVERFDHMMFVCRFQASQWSKPQREKLLCG